jgi:hypothetical protein
MQQLKQAVFLFQRGKQANSVVFIESHLALGQRGRVLRFLAFLLDFIWQAGVCDGDFIRLPAAPNKLALGAKSCEIRSRWNVANQICLLRFLPERVGLLLHSPVIFPFHLTSIE